MMQRHAQNIITVFLLSLVAPAAVFAQSKPRTEEDFYPMTRVPIPEDINLEAGGLELMPDGQLAIGTRRGDIYMLANPFPADTSKMKFTTSSALRSATAGFTSPNAPK